jgi:hypothetical protein
MGAERERRFVGELYPGKGWKERVSKMPDSQVLAIYYQKKKGQKALKKESKPDVEPF